MREQIPELGKVIDTAAGVVKEGEEIKEQGDKQLEIVEDEVKKELINELILSTNFPISIIIIGLGKGPFPNLENLEEKFLSFTDNEGNKPNRKNFKFVSFNNYSRNYQNTAKNSLIDIPDEMIEYLGIKNIEPKF